MSRATYSLGNGGIIRQSKTDSAGEEMVITSMQNVEPILDLCRELRGMGDHYRGEDNTMWHYAKIPMIFLEKWIQEYGAEVVLGGEDSEFMINLIEREYPFFKVGDYKLA